MKQLIIILALLLLVSVPASADWDKKDTALLALRVLDWGQTRHIAAKVNTMKYPWFGEYIDYEDYPGLDIDNVLLHSEINPILGEHPSLKEVNSYFIILIGLDQFLRYKAENSEKWANFEKKWQNLNIGIEAGLVARNYSLGIKLYY